jgi:hypothetical protein
MPQVEIRLLGRLPVRQAKLRPTTPCLPCLTMKMSAAESLSKAILSYAVICLMNYAISIRQPWAWAIIHAGKDVENRKRPCQFKAAVGQRVLIHASLGMTANEYADAAEFMASIGVRCPAPDELQFRGIIGSVFVLDIVSADPSPWFQGPAALVLADPIPEPFRPMRGQVGLFRVQP